MTYERTEHEDLYLIGFESAFRDYCLRHGISPHAPWVHWVHRPSDLDGVRNARVLWLRNSSFLPELSKLALAARKAADVTDLLRRIPK